jgi:hypothetical protein
MGMTVARPPAGSREVNMNVARAWNIGWVRRIDTTVNPVTTMNMLSPSHFRRAKMAR